MDAVATQKFIRMSPRKLRVVADMVRGMNPHVAVDSLPYLGKRAASPIQKVVKTAIANATVKGMNLESLEFAEIQINEGPRLKRFRAGSRGRAKPYTHDMSHIRVVVTDSKVKKEVKKEEVKPTKPQIIQEVKKVAAKAAPKKRKESKK